MEISFVILSVLRGYLGFYHFAAAQAGGTDANTLVGAIDLGVDRAQVDVPAPFAHVVGVADVVSELRPLAADITNLCHGLLQIDSDLDPQNIDFTGFGRFRQARGWPGDRTAPISRGHSKLGTYSTLRRSQYILDCFAVKLLFVGEGYPCLHHPRTCVPRRGTWTRRDSNPYLLPSQGAVFPLHHGPQLEFMACPR